MQEKAVEGQEEGGGELFGHLEKAEWNWEEGGRERKAAGVCVFV